MTYEERYYQVAVSREMLQKYMDLCNNPKSNFAGKESERQKAEIRMHIFTEAFGSFAHDFGPEEPALEVVS